MIWLMGSIGRSDIARATSTSTTKTTTTPTHATNGSASTALEPRGLRLRRPQPLWRAVTPSPATASLQPSPTISTTTAPFHTPSGSWRAKSQFQTAVLAPRQRPGSAGVYVYCENNDGSVCVDFKTRLVPFRLAQSQSVFSYVYIYICLSVCSYELSSSTLCVVCVMDFLLRCCLHLIAQNLNAFLNEKLVFVCICMSEKTT